MALRASRPTNSASLCVVADSGSKQITVTCEIFGAHMLPCPQYGDPREITSTGARCSQPSQRAVLRRLPDPFSITIALTYAGIPCSGQMNKRAVRATSPTRITAAASAVIRQLLGALLRKAGVILFNL
jgi:hypothetical protein